MRRTVFALAFALLSPGLVAIVEAQDPAISIIVSELRRHSRADALTIKDEYARLVRTAVFQDRAHLQRAIEAGELVSLSTLTLPHVQPRLHGESPIAEKDLENQQLYLALRPAAMGVLVDIARRVQYGPVELTSLVRTAEYQRALRRGNGNANTDVPTHAMGYAIDIGLKFASAEVAYDLRRVLERMRAAGDIYFIAEASQYTFHIVPVPSRMAHFEAVYQKALAAAAPRPPDPTPAPAPAGEPKPVESSWFADAWAWITSLFD